MLPKSKRRITLDNGRRPIVKLLKVRFAGLEPGTSMLVSTPREIDAYIRTIPHGKAVSVEQLRADLAGRHHADATCPASTGIYLRLVAEAALEQLNSAASPDTITPFWRVVEPASPLAAKLSCGPELIAALREAEGINDPRMDANKRE